MPPVRAWGGCGGRALFAAAEPLSIPFFDQEVLEAVQGQSSDITAATELLEADEVMRDGKRARILT